MTDQPAIRVAATKDFLDAFEEERPGLRTEVLDALPSATRELIEASVRIGWLPLEDHMRVLEAVREAAGVEALRPIWLRAMLRSFEAPTLRVMVEGAKRMFGMTPRGLIKAAPRGYGLLSRGLGTLDARGTDAEDHAELILVGFPSAQMQSGTFVEGLAGCFESFYQVCNVTGEVVISEQDPTASRAVFSLSWR